MRPNNPCCFQYSPINSVSGRTWPSVMTFATCRIYCAFTCKMPRRCQFIPHAVLQLNTAVRRKMFPIWDIRRRIQDNRHAPFVRAAERWKGNRSAAATPAVIAPVFLMKSPAALTLLLRRIVFGRHGTIESQRNGVGNRHLPDLLPASPFCRTHPLKGFSHAPPAH